MRSNDTMRTALLLVALSSCRYEIQFPPFAYEELFWWSFFSITSNWEPLAQSPKWTKSPLARIWLNCMIFWNRIRTESNPLWTCPFLTIKLAPRSHLDQARSCMNQAIEQITGLLNGRILPSFNTTQIGEGKLFHRRDQAYAFEVPVTLHTTEDDLS